MGSFTVDDPSATVPSTGSLHPGGQGRGLRLLVNCFSSPSGRSETAPAPSPSRTSSLASTSSAQGSGFSWLSCRQCGAHHATFPPTIRCVGAGNTVHCKAPLQGPSGVRPSGDSGTAPPGGVLHRLMAVSVRVPAALTTLATPTEAGFSSDARRRFTMVAAGEGGGCWHRHQGCGHEPKFVK
jgi:hypothetical protein